MVALQLATDRVFTLQKWTNAPVQGFPPHDPGERVSQLSKNTASFSGKVFLTRGSLTISLQGYPTAHDWLTRGCEGLTSHQRYIQLCGRIHIQGSPSYPQMLEARLWERPHPFPAPSLLWLPSQGTIHVQGTYE